MSSSTALPVSHPDIPLTTQGKRISQLIALDRSRLAEYKKHHQAVFPGVLAALTRAHIFGEFLLCPLFCVVLRGSERSDGQAVVCCERAEMLTLSSHALAGTDYSIHLYDVPALFTEPILIANMKYLGQDFQKDMQSVADDPETKRWWDLVSWLSPFHPLSHLNLGLT